MDVFRNKRMKIAFISQPLDRVTPAASTLQGPFDLDSRSTLIVVVPFLMGLRSNVSPEGTVTVKSKTRGNDECCLLEESRLRKECTY